MLKRVLAAVADGGLSAYGPAGVALVRHLQGAHAALTLLAGEVCGDSRGLTDLLSAAAASVEARPPVAASADVGR